MTGKNPANHGLFDFVRINPHTGKSELVFSNDCHSPTIWNYLNEAGKKVILVNIPMTYPPMDVDGIVIAGFPVPENVNFVFPPEMYEYIKKLDYVTDWMKMTSQKKNIFTSKVKIMKQVEKIRLSVFTELLSNHAWDVAMIVISGTDHVSHREWQKGDRRSVEKYYEYIDSLLYEFAGKPLFGNCAFVVISDHGFTATHSMFYLNEWLAKEGYLTFKKDVNKNYDKLIDSLHQKRTTIRTAKILAKIGLTRNSLVYFAKKSGLIKIEKFIPQSLIDIFPSQNVGPLWEDTLAYMKSVASKGININLQGREEHGIVPVEQYDLLRSELIDKLRSLNRDEKIFEIIEKREDIYDGPFVDEAPDIMLWPGNGYNIRHGTGKKHYLEKISDARHEIDGMAIFKGDYIKQNYTYNLNIEDVMPTLLHYLGLECPNDVNGKVAIDLFEVTNNPALNQVKFREPLILQDMGASFKRDDDSIIFQLKELGYL
jgi:predicted AlkP superfamily phosphohydrolase/phosphomutase